MNIVMKHKSLLVSILIALPCLVMTGCAGNGILVPAPSTSSINGDAVEVVKGIKVEVTGKGWEDESGVYYQVTPLQIKIINDSGDPVRITYSGFSLVDGKGNLYSVLPPFSLEEENADMAKSSFTCSGYDVAPYYSRYYPYMRGYDGPFFYDPIYYRHYFSCWDEEGMELPTKEMRDRALPEGVLWNKMDVEGSLYFEKISGSDQYIFRMELINAKDGKRFGEIRIPLTTQK